MALLRRILGMALFVGAVGAIVVFGTGGAASDSSGAKGYTIELDNAFGIVDGADVKIGGVRAGKVKKLRLDREDMRALVDFEITETGFDDVRVDVRCETRPQSLIGEYFIDCRPGTDPKRLPAGATIPVEQTETTVPVDLRSEEHTSELQSRQYLVCRLLLEKKKRTCTLLLIVVLLLCTTA